jgi:general secretion pathway protein L
MNAVVRFFKWWVEELARVVEPLVGRRAAPVDYALVQEGDRFVCVRGGRKGSKEVGSIGAGASVEADLLKRLKGQNVELRLDPDLVLDKKLTLPTAGQQYLDAILRHQIERLTPWAADHVAFDYVVDTTEPVPEGQVSIRLVATARETVNGALAELAGLGIKPRSVGTAADALDHQSPVNLQDDSRTERRSSLRRAVGVGLVATAAVIVILGGLQTFELVRLSQESADVQAAVEARRRVIAEAVARTTTSDAYRALAARKAAAVPMVVLLDELSKIIPADTYLTEISVDGEKLRVNGNSAEAPALIQILEDSPMLSEAAFGAPTTRNEKGTGDSFQIVAKIGAPQEAAKQ